MSPTIGVSHGTWAVPTPPDPPAGDYDAVLIADQGVWRFSVASQEWEEITNLRALRMTSPPTLPAVWYAWRNESGAFGPGRSTDIYKSTNNGTSWTALASRPFTPSGPDGLGEWPAWEDHLTAATAGILLTAKWSSVGGPAGGPLYLVNVYYSTNDGASWSQVFASDLASGNDAQWGEEKLVVNTTYTWLVWTGGDVIRRWSHGGGLASATDIALTGGLINIEQLACDSTLGDATPGGTTVYAVCRKSGETKRYIAKVVGTTVSDVTPPWGLTDANLGNVWLAVAGDTVMALAYGFVSPNDTASIWRSTDAGATWSMVRSWNADLNPLFTFSGRKAVAVNPNRPNTWFVWANNHASIGSKVMRSTDNGTSWAFHNLPSADPAGIDDQSYQEIRVLG